MVLPLETTLHSNGISARRTTLKILHAKKMIMKATNNAKNTEVQNKSRNNQNRILDLFPLFIIENLTDSRTNDIPQFMLIDDHSVL